MVASRSMIAIYGINYLMAACLRKQSLLEKYNQEPRIVSVRRKRK